MRSLTLILFAAVAAFGQGTVSINGTSYNYTAHPRLLLDGPTGPVTTAVKDPDGAGPQVAPKASMTSPPYAAMVNKIRPIAASYPPAVPDGDDLNTDVLLAATDWFSDNTQTNSLRAAIYWLDRVESTQSAYQFACDPTANYCGVGSWSDWPSESITRVAQAYTLVRSQMSADERATFAAKMLNDIDNGCVNQLQQIAGAVVTSTSTSAVLAGSGFSNQGLAAGDQIYFKVAGGGTGTWATIASVDSDTQITLTANAGATVTGGALWKTMPWTSNTCGLMWMLKHHPYGPANTIGRVAKTTLAAGVDTTQTSISVADATVFTAPIPFDISINGSEWMTVTGINGNTLTVTRGAWNSTPTSSYGGKPVKYLAYPTSGSTSGDYAHNLVAQKLYGYIFVALALLDDSPAAAGLLLDQAGTSWLRDTVPENKSMWTGFHQAGSSTYMGRQAGHNTNIALAFKNSLGIDLSAGNWIKNFAYYTLYNSLPGSPMNVIPWGQSDIAETSNRLGARWWIPNILGLYPGSDEAKYLDFWQRSYVNQYTASNLALNSGGATVLFQEYAFNTEAGAQTDFRTVLPTQWAFNQVDGTPNRAISAWISRTGWDSASDSLVFASAYDLSYTNDHIGSGNPASYKIWKNGWVLDEAGGAKKTGEGLSSNMIVFGGAANLKTSTQFQDLTLTAGGDTSTASSWAYSRIDATNAYTAAAGVSRALRHIVHLKAPGTQDYVIVYDDTASSAGTTKGINLYYDKTSGETSGMATMALPDLVWTGPNRKLSTKVLLPATAALTSTTATNGYKEYVCASLDGTTCDAANMSAEFLVVHRPSTALGDAMPAVTLLASDANFRVVQTAAPDTKVAAFPRSGGTYDSIMFTTTQSGNAQYVVAGLNSGVYQVLQNGLPIYTKQNVTPNGALGFTATGGGTFTINQNGPQPAYIVTDSLPDGITNRHYSATLTATGDTPITWSITDGMLPLGLALNQSTGAIAGIPMGAGLTAFTVQASNATGKDSKALSITTASFSTSLYGVTFGGGTTVR